MLNAVATKKNSTLTKQVLLSITMVSGNPILVYVLFNSSITAFDVEVDVQKASSIWNGHLSRNILPSTGPA